MADEPEDRLKKLESDLGIAKFAPRRITDEPPSPPLPPPLSQLIEMLRAHARGILDVCDQAERHVDGGEASMKKALDNLMDTIKRYK